MCECPDRNNSKHRRNLQAYPRTDRDCRKIKDRGPEKDGEVECREVVVQEELTSHEEEWRVVQCPSGKEKATKGVVLDDLAWRGMSIHTVCEEKNNCVLFSKSRNPRLDRRRSKPRSATYAPMPMVLRYQIKGLPIR